MKLNKNQEFLSYLIFNHFGAITITSIMKLAYLVDLVSIEKSSEQISDYKYIRYFYGPFAKEIKEDIESLLEKKVIKTEEIFFSSEVGTSVYKKASKDLDLNHISTKEKELIDGCLNELHGFGAKMLTNLAYKTKPMVALGATFHGNENLKKELNLFEK